ncbi:MAG: prolipoprotein diacylglyceryl transferase [Myxococcota bacterium]|nr:prolipoprotein diacylglyceryl transferase [Myxococcota bacterium]
MWPELFRIGNFSVSTFGVMLAIAFLVGTRICATRLEEQGEDPEQAWNLLLWMMLGGVFGSKLYFAIDVSLREGEPFWSLLFARAGITFYGGLIGGTLMGLIACRVHRLPTKVVADSVAVSLAVGQALGRIGCFLVGDDYGKESDVPWAMAFPEGAPPIDVPVHPTMLYEMVWLFAVAALLWKRRNRSPFLFGEYVALNGLGRSIVEIWRINQPVAFGLTEPQIIGISLVVLGTAGWLYFKTRAPQPDAA